uniref:Salutaridine reductase n=3 Tax=Vitis vinifera TaxID=29760 RepID=F6GW90_VITVI
MAKRSSTFGSIMRKRLSDITNSQSQLKVSGQEEKRSPPNNLSAEDYIDQLLKMKAVQHELICKEALLKANNLELEGKAKMNCQKTGIQEVEDKAGEPLPKAHDANRLCKANRRRPARSQSMGSSTAYQQVEEKETVETKRHCSRRQSCRFKSQQREPNGDLFEIEDAKLPVGWHEGGLAPSNSPIKKEEGDESCVEKHEARGSQRSSIGRPLRRAAEKVSNAGVSGAIVDWEAIKTLKLEDGKNNTNVAELLNKASKQTYGLAEECVKTNCYGTKGVTEALLRCLLLSNSGRIVNVSGGLGKLQFVPSERVRMELNDVDVLSIETVDEIVNEFLKDVKDDMLHDKGWPTQTSAYTISKAAMNAYTRIVAKSYPSLLINCVCPGFVKTDMTSNTGLFTRGENHSVLEITIYKKVCIKGYLDKCSVKPSIPLLIQKKMASTTSDSTTMRYAVVTGASKGIGLEICRQLASNGVMVVLTARDEKRGLEAVAKLHESSLSNVVFHQLDVMDANSITSLATFIVTRYGKLDILVNNAGVTGAIVDWESIGTAIKTLKPEDGKNNADLAELLHKGMKQTYELAEECVKTNYYGTKGVTEALFPCLLLSNSGRIVNVSSGLGSLKFVSNERVRMELNDVDVLSVERLDEIVNEFLNDVKENTLHDKGWPTQTSAYTISKAAMNAYTRIVAKSYPSLLINCVCPGFIKTDMTSNTGFFTVEVGAKGPVMLALLPVGGPSGLFFQKMEASTF